MGPIRCYGDREEEPLDIPKSTHYGRECEVGLAASRCALPLPPHFGLQGNGAAQCNEMIESSTEFIIAHTPHIL
jgi:hypothetical protein